MPAYDIMYARAKSGAKGENAAIAESIPKRPILKGICID
jgi:hypothetical protein